MDSIILPPITNNSNSLDIGLEAIYPSTSVTPYMHALANHVPQFMRQLNQKGLSLRYFSTSSMKKRIINKFLISLKK